MKTTEPLPATAELEIERVVHGGEGLGRWPGGKVAFVPFTLPGERVRAELDEERPGLVRASAAEILAPAPERVAPDCEYFFRCGGCQMQHAAGEAQLRLREAALRETLARVGKIAWAGPIRVHPSPPWGYRNRIRLHWGPDGPGYRARNSHAVVPITHCPIASPALNSAIAVLAAGPAPATAAEIELAADDADRAILAEIRFPRVGPAERAFAAGWRERIRGCVSLAAGPAGEAGGGAAPGGKTALAVTGPGHFTYRVNGKEYRVSHGSFFQVNRFLLDELAAAAGGDGQGRPVTGDRAADVFSGVGLFAVPLAKHFREVIAVEQNPSAAADLRQNAAGQPGLRVHAMDARRFLAGWRGPLDLLVVDPPRAGLGFKLAATVAAAAPRRLHYLSCDPATLARDLQWLVRAAGFEVTSVELFDLFPQTYHLETLVRLQRS